MFGGFDDIFGNMNSMINSMMMNNSPFLMPPMMTNSMLNNGGQMGSMLHNPLALMNGQMNSMMNNQLSMFGGGMPGHMTSMSFSNMPNQSMSFSSRTVSYSNDPTGRPQIYEETRRSVCGADGVRETKETKRDSRTGEHEIRLGRHINDRAHLKSKKRNIYKNEEESEEELVNLEEDELEKFNREFNEKTQDYRQKYLSIQSHPRNQTSNRARLALTNGPSSSAAASQFNQASCSPQQAIYNLQQEDNRPPSRGKKVKDPSEKKSKKKILKKPY